MELKEDLCVNNTKNSVYISIYLFTSPKIVFTQSVNNVNKINLFCLRFKVNSHKGLFIFVNKVNKIYKL